MDHLWLYQEIGWRFPSVEISLFFYQNTHNDVLRQLRMNPGKFSALDIIRTCRVTHLSALILSSSLARHSVW